MTTFRTAVVDEITEEFPGLQRLLVRANTSTGGDGAAAARERAYVLTELVPPCRVGDEVVMNTTAVDRGLGTGGWHIVHWNLSAREWSSPGPDHIMKLRYTSLQRDVGTSELVEPVADDLAGCPVVVCSLHSQMGAVAAAIGAARPGTRVGYVMTDGAALPIVLSDLVRHLRAAGLIEVTATAGHAIGGDLEAVTVASALGLVASQGVDAIIVAMGPGVVGTGTAFGTTAVEVGPILDTAAALGASPVICARISDGDARPRHQGLSHHTRNALRLCSVRPLLGVGRALDASSRGAVNDLVVEGAVDPVDVDIHDVDALFAALPFRITTMGRGVDEDRAFFVACAEAGALVAARLGVADEPAESAPAVPIAPASPGSVDHR